MIGIEKKRKKSNDSVKIMFYHSQFNILVICEISCKYFVIFCIILILILFFFFVCLFENGYRTFDPNLDFEICSII
jgi:hypothetical protein